ncbi:MAG: hypothetical protein HQ564_02105 [Candidatus Saganbacteria bacterium]|nr:hypothetical protein [Candidatus Saganbacteria bacterium]
MGLAGGNFVSAPKKVNVESEKIKTNETIDIKKAAPPKIKAKTKVSAKPKKEKKKVVSKPKKVEPKKVEVKKAKPKVKVPKIVIHTKKTTTSTKAVQVKKKKVVSVIPFKKISDPFTVNFRIRKIKGTTEAEESTAASVAASAKKYFILQGIVDAGRNSIALIDDKALRIGEYIHGWRVVGIKKDRVGLKRGGLIKRLYLKLGGY